MASFKPSKILLFGGTGAIGQFITSSLLQANPAFDQLVLFTSSNTASTKSDLLEKWKAAGLAVIIGDVTSDADITAAYNSHGGIDTVVSAVGRDVIAQQIKLLDLAEKSQSVKWFLPSEFGTDIEHNEKSPNEKPHQLKLKVRRHVRDSIKRVKVTYVVTGPYFDMWVNKLNTELEKAGGFDVARREAFLVEDGEGKIGFTTMWDVGKSVVATLHHPEQSFDKALRIQSFVVTPNEVLAEYEKQTAAKWKATYTPLDEIRKLEAQLWAAGHPKAVSVNLRRIWAEGGTLYEKNDDELVGLGSGKLDTLEDGVKLALKYKKEAEVAKA